MRRHLSLVAFVLLRHAVMPNGHFWAIFFFDCAHVRAVVAVYIRRAAAAAWLMRVPLGGTPVAVGHCWVAFRVWLNCNLANIECKSFQLQHHSPAGWFDLFTKHQIASKEVTFWCRYWHNISQFRVHEEMSNRIIAFGPKSQFSSFWQWIFKSRSCVAPSISLQVVKGLRRVADNK